MKFCVCIKQVPDVSAPVHTGRMVLNAYDASAVEEALVLTERYGGEIDLVLIGPASAAETIRKALAMGADRATHLVIGDDERPDSMAVAKMLADYLANKDYDVIATGKQAQDTDAGLTGSMLAERLGLPYASNAVGLAYEAETRQLVVTRQGDAGQEIIALPMPCLVTCSNDMNDPRIPTLKGIMGAKRKPIDTREVAVPAEGLPVTKVLAFEPVPEREPGQRLEGEPEEVARLLCKKLAEEARVL
ncbi:electron transfer flavoprotein subunit beta/FixA family protein [Rhodocaloribacter litoris]|nr:electron transfer flavoprotein subunit beta/FixA family protein [Rhodocaloribacter litoris]